MRIAAFLLIAASWLTACSDYVGCKEVVAEYDFAIGMLPVADTLEVNARYRVDYFGELRDNLGNSSVTEINPLFTIGIQVYRIDTNTLHPVLVPAAASFDVQDLVPGTFSGKNQLRINLSILSWEEQGFAGGVYLIPKEPGWYLLDLVSLETYPVERGSDNSCEKVQQVRYRLINTHDYFSSYYDEQQRASTFKPQTQRIIWVK